MNPQQVLVPGNSNIAKFIKNLAKAHQEYTERIEYYTAQMKSLKALQANGTKLTPVQEEQLKVIGNYLEKFTLAEEAFWEQQEAALNQEMTQLEQWSKDATAALAAANSATDKEREAKKQKLQEEKDAIWRAAEKKKKEDEELAALEAEEEAIDKKLRYQRLMEKKRELEALKGGDKMASLPASSLSSPAPGTKSPSATKTTAKSATSAAARTRGARKSPPGSDDD